jgi:hypothetical protein
MKYCIKLAHTHILLLCSATPDTPDYRMLIVDTVLWPCLKGNIIHCVISVLCEGHDGSHHAVAILLQCFPRVSIQTVSITDGLYPDN